MPAQKLNILTLLILLTTAAAANASSSAPSCTTEQDFDYHTPASTKEHCMTSDDCCTLCTNNTKCVAFAWKLFNSKT